MGFSCCHFSEYFYREKYSSPHRVFIYCEIKIIQKGRLKCFIFSLIFTIFRINQEGSPLFSNCDPRGFVCVCCLLFLVLLWTLSMSSCWCSKYLNLGLGALLSLSLRPSSTAQAFWIASSLLRATAAQAHSICSRPRLETTQPYCAAGNGPWDHSPGLGCCSALIVTHISRTFQ